MKVRDYILFGDVSGGIAAGATKVVSWINEAEDYYRVGDNEAVELIAMGVKAPANLDRTIIQDKDKREWVYDGFLTQNDASLNELPFDNLKDFSKVVAPTNPLVSKKVAAPVTLKMGVGDKFMVYARAGSSAVASSDTVYVAAILRKRIAENSKEQAMLEKYSYQFGGMDSNAQYYQTIGSISSTNPNAWNTVIEQTFIKSEMYAYTNFGIHAPANLLRTKITVDDIYTYNEYLTTPDANMLPFVEDLVRIPIDPTATAAYTEYSMAQKRYILKSSLIVKKNTNKNLKLEVMDNGTTISADAIAALRGVRYKL